MLYRKIKKEIDALYYNIDYEVKKYIGDCNICTEEKQ